MTRLIRSYTFAAPLILAGMLCTQSGAQQVGERCNIPFDFDAGNAHMLAGHYTIFSDWRGIVTLQGEKSSSFQVPQRDDDSKVGNSDKLVFTVVGGQYFLKEMRLASQKTYLSWPTSKAQKQQQMLVQTTAPSTTTVALVRSVR